MIRLAGAVALALMAGCSSPASEWEEAYRWCIASIPGEMRTQDRYADCRFHADRVVTHRHGKDWQQGGPQE